MQKMPHSILKAALHWGGNIENRLLETEMRRSIKLLLMFENNLTCPVGDIIQSKLSRIQAVGLLFCYNWIFGHRKYYQGNCKQLITISL